MEQLQLWENSKIRILIWKKVHFEDLNQILRKSWKKLSDNQESWRKLFPKKRERPLMLGAIDIMVQDYLKV